MRGKRKEVTAANQRKCEVSRKGAWCPVGRGRQRDKGFFGRLGCCVLRLGRE